MPKNKFVFLIRSYNESSRIIGVIESIFASGYTQVIVVDDGSTDDTANRLYEHFGHRIIYLKHAINRGAGAAMETGFAYVRQYSEEHNWQYVITFDADGQMDIADMQTFEQYLKDHPQTGVIFGSRFIEKTRSNVPWYRRIILFGGKIFTSFISGVTLTDAHNGYRLIATKVVKNISITMDGMEYASELIDEIVRLGLTIHEVPVHIHYDAYTLAKGQRFGGAIRVATRMLYKKFF